MKNNILIVFLFISILSFSQKIHVRYVNVRSDIATVNEDLYIDGNQVISRQDSLVQFKNTGTTDGNVIVMKKSNNKKAYYFISNMNDSGERDFFFTSYIKFYSDNFFVHDKVLKPVWKIDEKSTKKIAGYECTKATTNFRGSNIVAYFAKELPYSAGPFKFFGLPGLILDVRVENKSYDIWRAEKVEVNYTQKVNFKPKFETYQKIEMKNFMALKEQNQIQINKELDKDLKQGENIYRPYPKGRFGVEKTFEWEK
jgi:GLPGLI family protein